MQTSKLHKVAAVIWWVGIIYRYISHYIVYNIIYLPLSYNVYNVGASCPRSGWTQCCRPRPGGVWGAWAQALQVHRHVRRQGQDLDQRGHPLQGQGIIWDLQLTILTSFVAQGPAETAAEDCKGAVMAAKKVFVHAEPKTIGYQFATEKVLAGTSQEFRREELRSLTDPEIREKLEAELGKLPPSIQVVFANKQCQACGQVGSQQFKLNIQESTFPDWRSPADGWHLPPHIEERPHWEAQAEILQSPGSRPTSPSWSRSIFRQLQRWVWVPWVLLVSVSQPFSPQSLFSLGFLSSWGRVLLWLHIGWYWHIISIIITIII